MDYTSIVNKIKFLFTGEQKFVDVKTADGSALLRTDEVKVGNKISVLNADATVTDAPDGEYAVEGGSILVVKGGVIEEIKNEKTFVDPTTGQQVASLEEVKAEAEETKLADVIPATEPVDPAQAEAPEMDCPAEIESIKVEIEGLKQVVMQIVAAIESLTSSNQAMSKVVEDFGKAPAVATSIKEVAKFQKNIQPETEDKTKKVLTWAEKINQLKNK